MISVNGLTRTYGDLVAVNNISFTVRDGEITGLLGPNGAGKTTTLRMLTCFLRPDSGTIVINNRRTDREPLEVKKIIGYLPESAPIYGDMLVYDYLCYVADVRGITDRDRIREMGDLCGLNEVMHKNIRELSKGYRQRVGLAHAMIHDPDILILDEPTSGLDPNQIIEIRNLIREIGRKKTVILSTHILSEVEATCDRVIIIDRGRIIADDRTEDLHGTGEGDRRISLLVSGADHESLCANVKEISGVLSIEGDSRNDGLVQASVTASEHTDVRPELFRLAVEKNWVLYEMKQEQKSLESVFRQLTAGGENEQV